MFDHGKFGVSDYAASKAFFLQALEPLGVAVVSEGLPTYGVELSPKGKASLCLYQTEEKPAHLHLAFTAEDRQQVEAFYRAALEAGGKDNGAPGLRPHYHANYYAAFVIGPDGHNIEVVCHAPPPDSSADGTWRLGDSAMQRGGIVARDIVFTSKAAKPPPTYSQAVKAAGLVFVSGTAPTDPATGSIKGTTIQEQ